MGITVICCLLGAGLVTYITIKVSLSRFDASKTSKITIDRFGKKRSVLEEDDFKRTPSK